MLFSLKSDCFFRRYGNIGYIARPIIGIEQVFDEAGAIFIDKLGYSPKSIKELVLDLEEEFIGVNNIQLTEDALEMYSGLTEDGFLNSGENEEDFIDRRFDYSTMKGRLAYKSFDSRTRESSEIFLSNYSKEHPFLQNFHIELTSRCNERCIHCYIPHEKKDTDIDKDLMYRVLDQSKELGVMTIVFSGGEPMVHPFFTEFLKYAKDLDFNVTILSNLTILNDEILDALKYRHVSCVNVSLYSMDPEIHDRITTVNGSFKTTINNIEKLIDNNIAVQINCPVMKQNKDSFFNVINWGQDHKCSVITDYVIMARSDRTTDNLDNRLDKEEIREAIKKIAENSLQFQANIREQSFNPKKLTINPNADKEGRVCGVGLSTICMVANGDIYPCAGWQQFVCGNVNQSGLRDIWENSPEINYLRSLRLKNFEKCVGCEDYNYCLMCVSRNYNESSNGSIFDIPQITCDAAHINHIVTDLLKNKYLTENDNRIEWC